MHVLKIACSTEGDDKPVTCTHISVCLNLQVDILQLMHRVLKAKYPQQNATSHTVVDRGVSVAAHVGTKAVPTFSASRGL